MGVSTSSMGASDSTVQLACRVSSETFGGLAKVMWSARSTE